MDEEVRNMSFEESITALEELVAKLESGSLDLDESLKLYERATALRNRCKEILEESERRVQKITETAQGVVTSELIFE
mgnify:CR=1 FL=1